MIPPLNPLLDKLLGYDHLDSFRRRSGFSANFGFWLVLDVIIRFNGVLKLIRTPSLSSLAY